MNRSQRKLLNIFAVSLLAFAIYLNFFHKEKSDNSKHLEYSQASLISH